MTEWIKHDGEPIPVHPETIVRLRSIANGSTAAGAASGFYWPGCGGCEYKILHAHPNCPSINERAALNQAITTAMDMTRAGIAQSEPEWKIEESHQTHRDGFPYVDFCVCGDGKVFCTTIQTDAQWPADKLNGKA